jgi:ABC-type multidrug transport system fused ATPase/permease subunit
LSQSGTALIRASPSFGGSHRVFRQAGGFRRLASCRARVSCSQATGSIPLVRTDVEKLIAVSINVPFTSLVGIIFVVIYAFSVHWLIAPVYFLTVPVLGVLSSILSRKFKIHSKVIVAETTALGSI